MENIKISVAMATYNGEKYIVEQIDSILSNLKENDELVISDDGSQDKTIEIIKNYDDQRIKLFNGPRLGVKKNFENAIKKTTGDLIFLSDQDDIWNENKVEIVLNELKLNPKASMIVHDAEIIDSNSKEILYDSFFDYRKSKKGIIPNIIKNSYIGCCMAFKRELVKYIIPIPEKIEMHDQWIGIINELKCGESSFISKKLIKYRRHENNVSKLEHYPVMKMIRNRVVFIIELIRKLKNLCGL